MFKNSPSFCYIFFAVDDVIVTSVNTYTSMMGFSTEDKYLIKSLREMRNMEQSDCLKCSLTKTGSWWTENADQKIDNTGTVVWRMVSGRPCAVCIAAIIDQIEDLALIQEEKPQTRSTQWQISWQTGIFVGSVNAIIKKPPTEVFEKVVSARILALTTLMLISLLDSITAVSFWDATLLRWSTSCGLLIRNCF